MTGGAASQSAVKESSPLTFQCPLLTSTNYTIWRMRMEVILGIHGVSEVVDPGLEDAKKNNIVKGLLFQSIPEDLILQIENLKTGKEILKMKDTGTIDDYAAKLSGIASKSATLGDVMSEHKLVKKFLTSLPRRFIHIVAALEQVLDLKTIGFEDVVGLSTPTGIMTQAEEDDVARTQEAVVVVKLVKVVVGCYCCDKYGHFVSRCPERSRDHEANLNEAQEGDANHEEGAFFMMNLVQETIFLNEENYIPPKIESNIDEDDVWYLHNGASNHMTAKGVSVINHQDQICESFMVGKQTKRSFLKKATYKATNILEMIHGDICGPVDPPTQAGNTYILVLVDDFSRYMWSFLLKHKSDEFGVIKRFKTAIEKRTVERRNRTLLEMTRCLMKARSVPNYFWGEAVRHATFIINQTPTRALVGVTPYEKKFGEKPALKDLRVFGCVAYERVVSKHLKKLDDRSKPLVYLGKEPSSGGFRLFNPRENKIIISAYVICDEKSSWKWKSMSEDPDQDDREPGTFTISDPDSASQAETHAETDPTSSPDPPIRRSTRTSVLPQRLNDYELNVNELLLTFDEEPRNYNEAKVKPEWLKAMKTEIDSIEKNNTWNLVSLPKYVKPIGLKWLFKNMGFQRCLQEKTVYRKAFDMEFIIVAVYVDDLFVTEARMENCNATLCPMEPGLKLSKAENEPEVEATYYQKLVGCLRYLLHTRPDLTYSVGEVSRYMQSPRESHARAIKQILRYLKGTTSFGINYERGNDMNLVGYSDSSHNDDVDDGRSTTGHVFYLGTSPITWCSQKQATVALSSCEAEFMAATAAACQAIWLREILAELTGLEKQKVLIRVDNKSTIALSKNPVFHGRSKHIHTRYHFIRECVENEQVVVEHVSGDKQRADALTKALARIRFMEMRSLLGRLRRSTIFKWKKPWALSLVDLGPQRNQGRHSRTVLLPSKKSKEEGKLPRRTALKTYVHCRTKALNFKVKDDKWYKAHLIAKGFAQRKGIEYDDIYAHLVHHTIICVLLAVVAIHNSKLGQLDVKPPS
ncbi:hypothetical protein OSB04_019230 [Centaurea solstitialis]|uniref:CCHC-type domain-containing protein n=1 Tax=Centaurea solstitialis TaxID=347529 RepID=A0AA38T8D7_9ASTR|nr:hypothetical protein OSB04_019230 [Centaurea solstitialis]